MPDIITTTDFSDIADQAVSYACRMASDHGASLTLLHTYIMPVPFADTPIPVIPVEELKEIADEKMTEYVARLRQLYPNLTITSRVLYGSVVDCLLDYAEENSPWLIILSNNNQGDTGLFADSTIIDALRELKCPVIAVPPGTVYRPVRKICFACDLHNITEKFPSEKLIDLVLQTKATLHVLNVGTESDIKEGTIMDTERLHMYLSAVEPQYHFIQHKDADTAINTFVNSNNMDWLVMLPHKHSFFESLFYKSHTKAMTHTSHIPLVALHEKE